MSLSNEIIFFYCLRPKLAGFDADESLCRVAFRQLACQWALPLRQTLHYSMQAGGVKIAPPGFAISQPARRARAENGYQVIFTFFAFLRAALGRVI